MRWARAKMLWRLRNRLIVTYVFIGVIPVVLLVALAVGSFYLFAGQFATYIVTTGWIRSWWAWSRRTTLSPSKSPPR